VNRLEVLLPEKHQPELKRWAILYFFYIIFNDSKNICCRYPEAGYSCFLSCSDWYRYISPAGFRKGSKTHFSR